MSTDAFGLLQQRLEAAWRADLPGSTTEHVVVALPSYSVDPVLLAHYAHRLAPLEHRYLNCLLLLRNPVTSVVYLASVEPPSYIVDEYLRLLPDAMRATALERFHLVSADDPTPASLAAKFLARPDLLDRVRALTAGRLAFIEPWNVTDAERDLALAVDVPLFGADPDLWHLATKSGCRRLFRELEVPLPDGAEDLHALAGVVDAMIRMRARRPAMTAVIVKLNDSASGDGNAVVDLTGLPEPGHPDERGAAHIRLQALPGWFVQSLQAQGGVVEERIVGVHFESPSVQISVTPTGEAVVLSTHDQILGGHAAQVYEGCRFPAHPPYAPEAARLGVVVGRRLAELGVRGRMAVDFAASCCADGTWNLFALEVNLRKGGTTHPFSTMRILLGGDYDPASGRYLDAAGRPVHYVATDNYAHPDWTAVDPVALQAAVRAEGLAFELDAGEGVVLHMLNCLPVDGRFGVTSIARTPDDAARRYVRVGELAASLV